MSYPEYDIRHFPFSRYGAMVAVSRDLVKDELMIHDVRAHDGGDRALRVLFVPQSYDPASFGAPEAEYPGLPFESTGTPTALTITAAGGRAEFVVAGDRRLHLRAEGLSVLIASYNPSWGVGVQPDEKRYRWVEPRNSRYIGIGCVSGTLTAAGPVAMEFEPIDRKGYVKIVPEDGVIEADIDISQSAVFAPPAIPPRSVTEQTEKEWLSFLAMMPATPEPYKDYAQKAWFNLWSSYVRAQPPYHDDSILMSKKFMSAVWSWDHCFNALALSKAEARLALNQFLCPFYLQQEDGSLPDRFGPDSVLWACSKPPVHGWCMTRLMEEHDYSRAELEQVYGALRKWTGWWFTCRDYSGRGVPAYPRGCDSGLDNSTCFDKGPFVESADLCAYLALQMNCLGDIAAKLGRADEADRWRGESQRLIERMIGAFWDGTRFVPRRAVTGETIGDTDSILLYLPLVLGNLLPPDIARTVVEELVARNLTENGLASESPRSPKYNPDGYWRGPIWAPTTYLIVDGLRRMGETDRAREIARRFCDMCVNKAHGFYENFDALTGKGLRTPGYTWTSSVFLCMVWEYLA